MEKKKKKEKKERKIRQESKEGEKEKLTKQQAIYSNVFSKRNC